MSTPTVVPLMVWVAYVVWGYMCMALCQLAVIACRHFGSRGVSIAVQCGVGLVILVATVWYNNRFNSGDIRLYVLLGYVVGMLVYYLVCYDVVDTLAYRITKHVTTD